MRYSEHLAESLEKCYPVNFFPVFEIKMIPIAANLFYKNIVFDGSIGYSYNI